MIISTSPKEIVSQTGRDFLYLLSLIVILFIILLVVIHLDRILKSKIGQVKLPHNSWGILKKLSSDKAETVVHIEWPIQTISSFPK